MSSDFCYGARPVDRVITDYLGLHGLEYGSVEKISLYGHDGILIRGTEESSYCARDVTYALATDSQNDIMFRRVTSDWRASSSVASSFFSLGYPVESINAICRMIPADEDPAVDDGLVTDVLAAYGIVPAEFGFEQYVAELSNDIFTGTICEDFIQPDDEFMIPGAVFYSTDPEEWTVDPDMLYLPVTPVDEDPSQRVYLI